jgi:uncharacterized protein
VQQEPEFFLRILYSQLRLRDFPLSPMDFESLRMAMRAGFGWSSPVALRGLCCALWAKSRHEYNTVSTLFDRLDAVPHWNLEVAAGAEPNDPRTRPPDGLIGGSDDSANVPTKSPTPTVAESRGTLPAITIEADSLVKRPFVFDPRYPMTYRQVAQVWRRLRRPARFGAATELDLDATIKHRLRVGAATPPVLVPPRRNTARLLVLCDRKGSMAPYHAFCDSVITAILHSGRMEMSVQYYFHDVPEATDGTEHGLLDDLVGMRPRLDSILSHIVPLRSGFVYADAGLTDLLPFVDVAASLPSSGAVVIISDAGAARGRYDAERLVTTVAMIKALSSGHARCVWINPVIRQVQWRGTTAAELARHVPMFPMTAAGMNSAVNTLRGRITDLERPV